MMLRKAFPPLLLLACLPILLSAQSSLSIPYAPSDIQVDGVGGEWPSVAPFVFSIKNPRTLDTNRVEARLAWDEQQLYGLVEVSDRQLVKLRSGTDNPTLNLGDAIEIYIDPLADSRGRMDLNDYQFILDIGGDRAVFKGDKSFISEGYQTPKDTGLATIAFDFKCQLHGLLNDESNLDEGYTLEFSLPWAALGVQTATGTIFRLDLCVDDMDAQVRLEDYTESDIIVPYSFANWQGDTTFGFPDRWRLCQLAGHPDAITQAWRFSGKKGFLLLLLATLLASGLALRQYFLVKKLRQVPRQSEVQQVPVGQWAAVESDPPTSPNQALFERLRQFVLEKMDADLRPEDLAEAATVSLRQLQRLFREELGSTPHQFIIMLKMERAAELLRSGGHNVTEVSFACGYADPAYFSKVFKKYFGCAPRDY